MKELNNTSMQLCCPDCDSEQIRTRYERDEFEYGIGSKAVVLHTFIPVHYCVECGFEFTGEQAADKRHETVCRHLGLLAPVEILALRTKLQLSRAAFAELTGIGVASIARWESGELLQSRSNDNLMRLASFPENFERLAKIQNGENVHSQEYVDERKATERFKSLSPKRIESLRASQEQFALRYRN